jgi:hypothetical protein
MRTCELHSSTTLQDDEWCPLCRADWDEVCPMPDGLDGDDRAFRLKHFPLLNVDVSLDEFIACVSQYVGRSVVTHELATPVFPMLVEEARTQPGYLSRDAIMAKVQLISPGKPAMAVVIDPVTGEARVVDYTPAGVEIDPDLQKAMDSLKTSIESKRFDVGSA